MNIFLNDLNKPLDEMQTDWLRKSLIIILTPLVVVIILFAGIIGAFKGIVDAIMASDIVYNCWNKKS